MNASKPYRSQSAVCRLLNLIIPALALGILWPQALHAKDSASIKSIQQQLRASGFYTGATDGVLGSQTHAAIRRFQLAHRLRATGKLDVKTESLLMSKIGTPSFQAKSSRLADTFKDSPLASADRSLQIKTVQKAQHALQTLGYYQGRLDGDPGPATQRAIQKFQKEGRIGVASGRLDSMTLRALNIYTP